MTAFVFSSLGDDRNEFSRKAHRKTLRKLSICIKRFTADFFGAFPGREKQMWIGSLNSRLAFEIRLRRRSLVFTLKK